MSASGSSESPETKSVNSYENSRCINSKYTLYLFSNNKHASTGSECGSNEKEHTNSAKNDPKNNHVEEPSVCLSLLEGNVSAEQETVVRCYLLKTLSGREDLSFENEGKYAELQFSDDLGEPFGCYYHRLSKHSNHEIESNNETTSSKLHTFFICLIGPSNGIMESYPLQRTLLNFSVVLNYKILIPLLDPEGLKNRDDMQLKLKSWYFHCVEYIQRCVENYNDDLLILLLCSLWGSVEIVSQDEQAKWDTERFVETCCVMPKLIESSKESFVSDATLSFTINVTDRKIEVNQTLDSSPYCLKWLDKLKSCPSHDYIGLHNILEGFRLKTVQDLNTLKRLLQKAQTDHYSLYRAYQFLQASGYEDILLYHVKKEASMAEEQEVLEIISCLQEFLKNKHSKINSKVK
ncbi:protein Njmu-R1 [Trichonephila inaurata madagascariensis]|uniref:Protein Njmu-R1 n=1 Tax=Trichonephila inaurata madagascariensis TaxID=2747483 RepID=A0A8X7CD30_9ARAC|nr:protein Njmu-R1 [Trichonephila inaurata madagascariensis]